MQVYSINSFSCCPPRKLMNNEPAPAPNPTPAPSPTPAPNPAPTPQKPEEGKASIYFGSSDNGNKPMRWLLVPATLLSLSPFVAGCDDGDSYSHTETSYSDTAYFNTSHSDTAYFHCGCGHNGCGHDSIPGDTTHTDTTHKPDPFVRSIPLDTIMKDILPWGIDGTAGASIFDGKTRRNIMHYEMTHNWEYNQREIGDFDQKESCKYRTIYNTEMKDYKGNHLYWGKRVFSIPSIYDNIIVEREDGSVMSHPSGFYHEIYRAAGPNTSINDKRGLQLVRRDFCQTNSANQIVKVYTETTPGASGYFVEDGDVQKGYLPGSSILLNNITGDEDPVQDHLIDVEVEAVDDETYEQRWRKANNK